MPKHHEWLLGSARWLLILSPLAAMVVYPWLLYPTVTSKVLTWSVLVEVSAVLCGIWILLTRLAASPPWRNSVIWAFSTYVAVLLVTSLIGEHPVGSIWGTLERGDGVVFYFHLLAFIFMSILVLRREQDWRLLMQSVVVAGVVAVVVGIAQAMAMAQRPDEPWVRVGSVFGNANTYGNFLLFAIFFTLMLLGEQGRRLAAGHYLTGSARWMRWVRTQGWYLLALVLLGYGLALTASRGPALGLLAGGAATAGVLVGKQLTVNRRRLKTLGWCVGALAIVAVATIALTTTGFRDQLRPFFNYSLHPDGTAARRLAIWQAGLDAASEHWMLGWGWNTFRDALDQHFPPQVMRDEGSVIIFDRAHNFVVDHLVAGGVLALGAYLVLHAVLIVVWLSAWRRQVWSPLALASMFGLLVANFTFNLFSFPWVGSYIGWIVLLSVFAHLGQRAANPPGAAIGLNRGVGVGLIMAGLLAFAGATLPMGVLVAGRLPHLREDPKAAAIAGVVERYPRFAEEILHLFPEEQGLRVAVERRPRSFQLVKELILYYQSKGWPVETRPATATYVMRAQQLAPTHPVSHLMAVTFATAEGRYEDAMVSSERAIALNPKLSLPYWAAAEAAVRWGRVELAWQYVERAQAVERDPDRPGRYLSSYSFRPARMRAFAALLVPQKRYQQAADILVAQVLEESHFHQHDVAYQPQADLEFLVKLVQWVDQQEGGRTQAREMARAISEKIPILAEQLAPYVGQRR